MQSNKGKICLATIYLEISRCPIEQGSQGVADGRDPNIRAYQEKLVEPNSRAGNNSFIYLD